jgi:hypothetical protein
MSSEATQQTPAALSQQHADQPTTPKSPTLGNATAMLSSTLKRLIAALAVIAGLLVSPGPASAILYDGHAELGASVYQHNQTDLE